MNTQDVWSNRDCHPQSESFAKSVGQRTPVLTLADMRAEKEGWATSEPEKASVLVLLQGKAQVGKSTIAGWLRDNAGYTILDAGDPLRCIVGMGLEVFGHWVRTEGREKTWEFLKENKEYLIDCYEMDKEESKANPEQAKRFRNETIGIAEYFRCFDAGIWPRAAFLLTEPGKLNVGFVQDANERQAYGNLFGGRIVDVKLSCQNAGEDDTRRPFNPIDFGPHTALEFLYNREESLKVAEKIAYEVQWMPQKMEITDVIRTFS